MNTPTPVVPAHMTFAKQSTSFPHVAIIMDGNGRWAERRGLPRIAGHRAGAEAVRRVVTAACDQRVSALTLYAFSSDNWRRPPTETSGLMKLFAHYLRSEVAELVANDVRIEIIGRRDRLPPQLLKSIDEAEAATQRGRSLHFRLAVDYSGRAAIATNRLLPDVDLMIRTGGEHRLSDFLLWECAYAELYFTPVMWPDFEADDLATALREFSARERRFGGLPATSSRAS